MPNASGSSETFDYKNAELVRMAGFMKQGYNDFLACFDFPQEYEHWSHAEQINYEYGRLRAVNILAAKTKPPVWRGIYSKKAEEAFLFSVDMVGPAIPTRRPSL